MSDGIACVVLSLADEPGLVAAVGSLLDQSPPPDELVVVNSGGGTPARALAAAGLDVRLVDQAPRLNPGAVRNLGIAATTARYVAFLAADCVALPGCTEGRLREHGRGAAAVAGTMANATPRSRPATASFLLQHNRRLPHTPAPQRAHYSLSYDRELFERFGLFRDDLRSGEDTEFNGRFAADEPIAWAQDVAAVHAYPTTVASMVADQFARGRRQAITLTGLRGVRQRAHVASWAPGNVADCVRRAGTVPVGSRTSLLAALPLVAVGAVAHATGALTTRRRLLDEQSVGPDPLQT
ncbi:MAG: glycosyltransferase family A protein [Thermoleophilia bacterium]